MNRTEYRKLHTAARALHRFAKEVENLGVSAVETPNHPAMRGMVHHFHQHQEAFPSAFQTMLDRPASHRYPLHQIPADLRHSMHSDAWLRRCGVLPRPARLPLPR